MFSNAIVVGAGIVGLATARALAMSGRRVTVLDRNCFATGASIRNFGMVWPIGQASGLPYDTAIRSRNIWSSICDESGIWCDRSGSIHLAYSDLELEVLVDFHANSSKSRKCEMLDPERVLKRSPFVVRAGLKGGLFSPDEIIVDPPAALRILPVYLKEKFAVNFIWDTHVHHAEQGIIVSGNRKFHTDEIYICTGPDYKNLFPDSYAELPIELCKLQMMRLAKQPWDWKLGPSLCGGLSLAHYSSFREAGQSLIRLKNFFHAEMQEYMGNGIHVMVSGNSGGELIVGDSHHYAGTHDPFDRADINGLILRYLKGFLKIGNDELSATWNGTYVKLMDGRTELVLEIKPGITIINALGGAGMTLSFGLAERVVGGVYPD